MMILICKSDECEHLNARWRLNGLVMLVCECLILLISLIPCVLLEVLSLHTGLHVPVGSSYITYWTKRL